MTIETCHSLERDFLFLVIRSFITKTNCPEIPVTLNWYNLDKIITRHKLAAIVYYTLNTQLIPSDHKQKWKEFSINSLLQYFRSLKAVAKLLTILENGGIPAVTLRGMALAEWIYPEPSLRPMQDVDILIPSYLRNDLVNTLKTHGLTPYRILRSQFVYHIDQTYIEIHWSFLTPKRYRNVANFDLWINSRKTFKTSEGKISHLKPEDELIELICHVFIHHELDRILQLIDIGLLLMQENMDWDYLKCWCKDASLTKMFCFTISYIDYLFELNFSKNLEKFNTPPFVWEKRVFEAYESQFYCEDKLNKFLTRKKNLLFVAERPFVKIKQIIRFFNSEDITTFFGLLFRTSWKT